MSGIDADRLRRETFLQRVERYRLVTSTNDVAAELIRQQCETPCLVVAEQQTAGRGRGRHRWWSRAGGLTFSLILNLEQWQVPPRRRSLLSLLTGIALAETLACRGPAAEVSLKWPNDLLIQNRKLGGILIESSSAFPDCYVVGIGLNLNNGLAKAPEEIRQRAISCCEWTGETWDFTEFFTTFLPRLERQVSLAEDVAERFAAWCHLTGKMVEIDTGGAVVAGCCQGVDEDGRLLVRTGHALEALIGGTVLKW